MNWTKIWNFFKANVWNIVLFFAVLLIGIILVKVIINIIRRILNKTKMEKIAVGFVIGVLKVVLYLCLVLILLSIIGIEVTGVLTALSALLLSVGLALQNNIANVANGIIIVSSKMFKKGDYITVNGVEGSITQINFLFTTLITPDNKRITIPNSTIVNSAVIDNDSNLTRRVNFAFSVSYDSDVELVKKVVIDCMKSNGKVLLDPAPFCRLNAMNDSSLEFAARCWCDSEDYWDVYFDIMETVFNELKRNKISIPYNQLEIRERKDNPPTFVVGKGLPERVEKVREEKKEFDLENANLSDIFAKKKKRNKKQDKKLKLEQVDMQKPEEVKPDNKAEATPENVDNAEEKTETKKAGKKKANKEE